MYAGTIIVTLTARRGRPGLDGAASDNPVTVVYPAVVVFACAKVKIELVKVVRLVFFFF